MADLLHYLRDRRVIVEKKNRWMVSRPLSEVERELPESVRSMIARKIERLTDADRKLLVAASVQGHEFDSAVVSEALGADPGDVEDRLEALDRVHVFVRAIGEHEFPDRTLTLRYRFVHVLYQNVLYGSLQPTRRASLSGKVATALARHHGPHAPAVASELAMLYEAARDFPQAAAQFLEAAQHAAGLFGFREAAALAKRGLAALAALPEDATRLQQELGLQLILGLSLRSFLGWAAPEVEKVYTRAREVCSKLGDPPELFPVLWGLTLVHAIRGDLRIFKTLADQLLAQAEQTGTTTFLVAGHQMMASVCEFMGETVKSSEHFERAVALHDPAQHVYYSANFGLDPGMIARAISMRPLWYLGLADRSLDRMQQTLALARSVNQPITLAFAIILAERIRVLRGELNEAVALGDEAIALCREYGLAQEMEWARCFQALAYAHLGRADEGVEQLKDSLAAMDRIKAGLLRSTFLANLGEALLKAGRYDEGLRAVADGFVASEKTLERCDVAELHRVRGELLRQLARIDEAEESFRAAIAVARPQGARAFELRAATGLARLLKDAGRTGEARELLDAVYGTFVEGFDTRDLVEARELLATLAK
jgi:adenylate cyclase